jgi:hypothetical protein
MIDDILYEAKGIVLETAPLSDTGEIVAIAHGEVSAEATIGEVNTIF